MKAKPLIYNKANNNGPFIFDRKYEKKSNLIPRSYVVSSIKKVLMDHYEMSEAVFATRCRRQEYVLVRQLFAYFLYMECPTMSLLSIGAEVGGSEPYDHSTVNNSLTKISNRLETDVRFSKTVKELSEKIERELLLFSDEAKLVDDYYVLDMNRFNIMDIGPGKAIVFVGIEEHDIRRLLSIPEGKRMKLRNVSNTGFRVLKKIDERLKTKPKEENYEKSK